MEEYDDRKPAAKPLPSTSVDVNPTSPNDLSGDHDSISVLEPNPVSPILTTYFQCGDKTNIDSKEDDSFKDSDVMEPKDENKNPGNELIDTDDEDSHINDILKY